MCVSVCVCVCRGPRGCVCGGGGGGIWGPVDGQTGEPTSFPFILLLCVGGKREGGREDGAR